MQIFHNDNISDEKTIDSKSNEISLMVNDFVQMWTRFEVMVQKELAKQNNLVNQLSVESEIDYGHFYRASSVIYPKKQMTMGEFSVGLSVPLSKATRIANLLVDNGLAQRLTDPEDRRIVRITLSEKGQNLHLMMSNYMQGKIKNLLTSSLTDEERAVLLRLINRVASTLKKISG
jgi:DNA-binding MarR family transcriptional regulator